MKVLVLGGTAEARALAAALLAVEMDVVSSLAGRVSNPTLPPGPVRVGGFGGVAGLVAYLRAEPVDAVVDATHPFAAQMSGNAAAACASGGVPLVRLARPGWGAHADAANWTWVRDTAGVLAAGASCRRPCLTTGRQTLAEFLPWAERPVLARVVDPPAFALPAAWRLLTSRGPYEVAGERRILADHGADLLVTKDSGGAHTEAKLAAARELGVPVVVIARPDPPAGVATVSDVPSVMIWLATMGGRRS